MNTSHKSKVKEQAARWFARMQNAAADHPERSKFEAWLMGDHSHAEAYASLSRLWGQFEDKEELQKVAQAVEFTNQMKLQQQRKTRINIAKSITGMLMIALGSLLGIHLWDNYRAQPVMQLATNTAVGQIKIQKLEDGSELTINANSEVEVTYYRDRRTVNLKRGEVIFNVAKNPEKPFIVNSDYAKVTVLGTRFVVNRLSNLVRISVDHGKVRVENQAQDGTHDYQPIILTNGQVGEVMPQQPPQRSNRSASDAFGFSQGTIAFEQATLQEIAEVLSRYRHQPVVALPSEKDPRVTALVQIKTLESFIKTLPNISSVAVIDHKSETVLSAK